MALPKVLLAGCGGGGGAPPIDALAKVVQR